MITNTKRAMRVDIKRSYGKYCLLGMLALFVNGCGEGSSRRDESPSGTGLTQSSTLILTPVSCVTSSGGMKGACSSLGNTPLQTGGDNSTQDQVTFQGKYSGYQVFKLPGGASPDTISKAELIVNYQGPSFQRQVWSWSLYNWSKNSYDKIGNNSAITSSLDWEKWTPFTFAVTNQFSSYVSSDGQIRVQIASNNSRDDVFIDYEALRLYTQSASAQITISPESVTLHSGETQQFSAIISGNTDSQVVWSLEGAGDISISGLYTAPQTITSASQVTIVAKLASDNTVSSTASISLAPDLAPATEILHGVTIADDEDIGSATYLTDVLASLNNLSVTPTVRLVYSQGTSASDYLDATKQIHQGRKIMGEVIDSASMSCYTITQHAARWNEYISTLADYVDIWEVGNEVNGDWNYKASKECPGGPADEVATKISNAYKQAKAKGKQTALTLFFDAYDCPQIDEQMLSWASAQTSDQMKTGLDYVFVSFYPQYCAARPYDFTPDWDQTFSRLRAIFPNAKFGMGEIGWDSEIGKPGSADLKTLIESGSRIKPNVDGWVGGGFYWEFGLDAVPYSSSSVWSIINAELARQ